jgi:hypothetical protein
MSSGDEIRKLCSRALLAEGADVHRTIEELHAALSAHIESVRAMAASALLNPTLSPPALPEPRITSFSATL